MRVGYPKGEGVGTRKTTADECLSKLRVARATLIAVRVCLEDAARRASPKPSRQPHAPDELRRALAEALTYAERGKEKLEDAHVALSEAFAAAGVPFRPARRPDRPRKKGPARRANG